MERKKERVLRGKIFCPGIAIGKAHPMGRRVDVPHATVARERVIEELERNAQASGLVTWGKTLTSLAAILLKSFNISFVGMVEGIGAQIRDDVELIIDGMKGQLIVHPSERTRAGYLERQLMLQEGERQAEYPAARTRTRDGTEVTLLDNIDNLLQLCLLWENGLEGVGLFRTEFLLFGTSAVPAEEEQYAVYRKIMETMQGRRMVMRTFET